LDGSVEGVEYRKYGHLLGKIEIPACGTSIPDLKIVILVFGITISVAEIAISRLEIAIPKVEIAIP
jgi:hypothetical protein